MVLAAVAEAWWVPVGAVVAPVGVALAAAGAWEVALLVRARVPRIDPKWCAAAAALVAAAPATTSCPWWIVDPLWPLVGAAGLAVVLSLLRAVWGYRPDQDNTSPLLGEVFVVVYVGALLGALLTLRWSGPRPQFAWGVPLLVTTVLVVKSADIGAYTLGRLMGRHKLAPRLSPGKTVEGALGGLLAAGGVSWLCFRYLLPMPSGWPARGWAPWAFAVLIFAAGLLGDLSESLLKRDAGRKDSSASVPGFGGVMDLLDSVLVAAPAALVFFRLGG